MRRHILEPRYTRLELIGIVGQNRVTDRQIERWISKGIIGSPLGGRGRGAYYTNKHLSQLKQALDLMENNMTLADIADRINPPEDDDDFEEDA